MNSFQTITIVIALILLVIILGYLGYMMSYYGKGNKIVEFPTKQNICPDRWKVNLDGHCVVPLSTEPNYKSFAAAGLTPATAWTVDCSSTTQLASDGCSDVQTPISFDPLHTSWTAGGKTSICTKKEWANKNGILWDGVSNYTKC